MNTAFISSTGDLCSIRNEITDKLIDFNIFPFAMEHFAVPTIEGFQDIKRLIDKSDVFILILGERYGSRNPEDGKSWTQKEYEYCVSHLDRNKTKIWVVQLPGLTRLTESYKQGASDEQLEQMSSWQSLEDIKDQIHFALSFEAAADMKKNLAHEEDLIPELMRFVNHLKDSRTLPKWERDLSEHGYRAIQFGERYSQVHLSENDPHYLRVGTVIFQKAGFLGGIKAKASNYQVKYVPEEKRFIQKIRDYTKWEGNYYTDGNKLTGLYQATKNTSTLFMNDAIERGRRDGIHKLEVAESKASPFLAAGTFQDAVSVDNPRLKCKTGNLFIFETEADMIRFLEDEYSDVLKNAV